jgi:Subtilase family
LPNDIAIIDSGANPAHPHVQGVAGGLTLELDSQGRPMATEGFEDRIGHGTAIAGIFREKLPAARVRVVKIFQSDLSASSQLLFAALEWAIEANMKIIHLSLGTEREQDRPSLERLCRSAHEKGIIILAAARGHDDVIYPAALKSVIGVYWDKTCERDGIIFHPDNPIEFGAWGYPRPLPGLDRKHNFCGSSFAVAHVSVRVARILEAHPTADSMRVKNELARDALTISSPTD